MRSYVSQECVSAMRTSALNKEGCQHGEMHDLTKCRRSSRELSLDSTCVGIKSQLPRGWSIVWRDAHCAVFGCSMYTVGARHCGRWSDLLTLFNLTGDVGNIINYETDFFPSICFQLSFLHTLRIPFEYSQVVTCASALLFPSSNP